MSDKAAKKKQFILDTAKGVFAKKGYKDVTMKDIVDACEISRGGLYLYFDSTEALLLACLSEDDAKENQYENHTAGDALAMFLNEQKKAILSKEEDLTIAVYEYLFLKKSEGVTDTGVKSLFDKHVDVVTHLIQKGVESEEFYCEDCALAARNIMYTLEGLKIMEKTIGVSEKEIDMELLYILSGLIVEE